MKKVYEPGEMFREAYLGAVADEYAWSKIGSIAKKTYAEQERRFMNLLSLKAENDEQTDDSSGLPASLMN